MRSMSGWALRAGYCFGHQARIAGPGRGYRARRAGTGTVGAVSEVVSPYHRLLGHHAQARSRLSIATVVGIGAGFAVWLVQPWQFAVLVGWDVLSLVLLATMWHTIGTASTEQTRRIATAADPTRRTSQMLLVTAAVVSLGGVGMALRRARQLEGGEAGALAAVALVTVVVSWALVNTVYTLHYAHQYYLEHDALDFGGVPGGTVADTAEAPNFIDFAYLAFTVGMTYQVSDTNVRGKAMRRTVLRQSLLAYLFGVVIVAMTINVLAGFL